MSKALDDIKRQLLERYQMDVLLNGTDRKREDERLVKGLRDINVAKMIEQLEYIDKDMLPKIEKKMGKKSADYEFFESVVRSLMAGVVIYDRYDVLYGKWINEKIMVQLLRDRLAIVEKELLKYESMEDLFFTDGLNKYADGAKKRISDAFEHKKRDQK